MNPPASRFRDGKPHRIVLIDDEPALTCIIEKLIRRQFSEATVSTFQNRDKGWLELLRCDPDLLITDMNNDNVPGRSEDMGISGWKMLPMLAERRVKHPILVISGSFLVSGAEDRARKCAGPDLNISFLAKPFSVDSFEREVIRLLS